jgi:NADH-quinone oxidoreductase subunit M
MNTFHFPWLQLSILAPLAGAAWVSRVRDADHARRRSLVVHGFVLACTLALWLDFAWQGAAPAADRWDLPAAVLGRSPFAIDVLSAPLLPLAALLYLLTSIATQRTKLRRYSFASSLVSEGLLLALLACRDPWGVILLLALSTIPPGLELRARGAPLRLYTVHMGLFVGLLIAGWLGISVAAGPGGPPLWAVLLVLVAVCIRSGVFPAHCWMTDLFEHATFGTALLFVAPMPGAYAAVRLLLPIAPVGVLSGIGLVALFTALYAAGMALVQREARRFFCYLFLSHSALVFVGLQTMTATGLTGALCVWLSVGLGLGGLGLTLRALEARHGRLALTSFLGEYDRAPTLAVLFLLTGLATVGFPGTFGFVGSELLVEGAVHAYPHVGLTLVVAAALNGIAVLHAYFLLFTGTRRPSSVPLYARLRERVAVLTLAVLILGGGLFPQPGVASRHRAAIELLSARPPHPDSERTQRSLLSSKVADVPLRTD